MAKATNEHVSMRAQVKNLEVQGKVEFEKEKYEYISAMVYRLHYTTKHRYSIRNRQEEPTIVVTRTS